MNSTAFTTTSYALGDAASEAQLRAEALKAYRLVQHDFKDKSFQELLRALVATANDGGPFANTMAAIIATLIFRENNNITTP